MIDNFEVDPDTVRERLREKFGQEKIDRVASLYEVAYRGSLLPASEIWKEVICDSLGDMNIYSEMVEEGEVQEFLEEVKKAASAEQETRRNRGPPAETEGKASIESLPDGRLYVKADRQVIFGNDPESWRAQLEDYINGKIRRGEDVQLVAADGDVLTLTTDTAGKVSSPFRGDGTRLSDTEYERKVNAGTHIDELAKVSRSQGKPKGDEGGRHGAFAGRGWDYRDAYFQDFDGTYYKVTISAAISDDGKTVYNIGKIRERDLPNRMGSSAKGGALDVEEVSPRDSISETDENVNGKFSMELPIKEYTEQEKKDHAAAALAHFGRTFSWKETAYLTQDGKKIDFSGRNEGAPGGSRTLDHRDIRDALGLDYGGEDYSGAMVQFMAEGNIRIMPESNGINLSVLPTKAQEEALDDFISRARGEVILDIDDPGKDIVVSVEYPRGTRASKVLNDIRQYFGDGTIPQISEVSRYRFSQELPIEKMREEFRQDLAAWNEDGRPGGESFILGSTGPVLQGLGAIESDIYMEGDKINSILHDHPEMTLREIQRIPDILEDPVLVLKSNGSSRSGQNTRLVLFGSVKAQNGQPVMCVLDLRPVEGRLVIQDMQKVNSSYTRDNALNYVQSSEIMHADKNRAIPLLRSIGLHGPIELQQSGSMGSITYKQRSVNLSGVPFSDVVENRGEGTEFSQELEGIEELRRENEAAQRAKKPSSARARSARSRAAASPARMVWRWTPSVSRDRGRASLSAHWSRNCCTSYRERRPRAPVSWP